MKKIIRKVIQITIFCAIGFLLVFVFTLLTTSFTLYAFQFMKDEHPRLNLYIIRGFGVLAAFASAFFIAFPAGIVLKRKSTLLGLALPVAGVIPLFVCSPSDTLFILSKTHIEWIALVIACGIFCRLGFMLRKKWEGLTNR